RTHPVAVGAEVPERADQAQQKDQEAGAGVGLGQAVDEKQHEAEPEQAHQQQARAQGQQQGRRNGRGQQQGEVVGVGQQAHRASGDRVDVVQGDDPAGADAQHHQAGQPEQVQFLVEQQGQHEQRQADRQLAQGFQRQRDVPAVEDAEPGAEEEGQQQLLQVAAQPLLGQLTQQQLQRHHQDQGVTDQLAAGDGAAFRKQAFDGNHGHQAEDSPGGPPVQHAQGD